MKKRDHWNLGKVGRLVVCQLLAMGACLVIVLFYSPSSETLVHVNRERLLFYSSIFGLSFLLSGEVFGLFVNSKDHLAWKKFFLSFASAAMGSIGLLILVWTIEFDFIGRLAIFKMVTLTGLSSFVFLIFLEKLTLKNPWLILPLLDKDKLKNLQKYKGLWDHEFQWVTNESEDVKGDLLKFTAKENVDVVLVESNSSEIKVMTLLASGVRVMGLLSFWETFAQRIPHSEVDESWLTKLDLRQHDPLLRRVKRLVDVIISIVGLLITFPILVLSCIAIAVESGFPLFYRQQRSGYLGRPYVLCKLRTMRNDSEKSGAKWAALKDDRVTFVGRLLRRVRIDELPQFWNVIKGEMSVVGPRPERPELEEEIVSKLPYWKCRYLLKPGITGWAQIKYKYASDFTSSEEKLAYDLFYVKNASFFLDLEIMLSTLRSLMKGSR